MTDSWMEDGHRDGRMHRKIMLLLHTLMRGSDLASLVEFCPVVYEEIA